MNIPRIKNPIQRRLHLLWIAPYMTLIYIPAVIYYGLKEIGWDFPRTIKSVWVGR